MQPRDLVHVAVFVLCVVGGAMIARLCDHMAMEGMAYGLVAWVALTLVYLCHPHAGRDQETRSAAESSVAEDEAVFEDGRND